MTSGAKPSPQRLAELMKQAGLTLNARQLDQFWAYHTHLRARNEELNMTRIYEFEAMVVKLYIDSAIVGKLVALPSPLVDIGTGPGFPGLPLAILHPEVEFILSEGRHKRNEFLRECVALLGLKNVEVLGHRVAPEFDRPVRGVITRAVETLDETLNRVLRCLQPGGTAIFMKGPDCDDEIAAANRRYGRYYTLKEDVPYALLDTENKRRLVVYERSAASAPQAVSGEAVTSPDNARVRGWKTLLTSRGVKKEGLALAAGKAAVEILAHEPDAVTHVVAREGAKQLQEQIGFATTVVAAPIFESLGGDARYPVAVVTVPAFGALAPVEFGAEAPPLGVYLALQDPAELGAAVRAAAAFGRTDVVLAQESAHPYHPEALRAGGVAVVRAKFTSAPPVAAWPRLPGAVRLAGPADLSAGAPGPVFVGAGEPPWPAAGKPTDPPLDPATVLAASLNTIR